MTCVFSTFLLPPLAVASVRSPTAVRMAVASRGPHTIVWSSINQRSAMPPHNAVASKGSDAFCSTCLLYTSPSPRDA
eukprot:10062989-Lingulodinium_polyedra.AAC.1